MSPVGWKHRARQQFSAGKTRICSSRTVAGQFQLQSGMHPFGWKPRAKQQFSAGRAILCSSRTVAGQFQFKSGMRPFGWKPTARQQFQCRQSEILQQQKNSSRAVLTQIGHEPGRLEAQGQTAVQCRPNENLQSRTVAGQFQLQSGMHPFGWNPRVKQQFSAGRDILRSSRTVTGLFQIRSGMHPFGWKPTARQQFQCRPSDSSQQQRNSNRTVLTQIGHEPGRLEAQGQTAVQCRPNENLQ